MAAATADGGEDFVVERVELEESDDDFDYGEVEVDTDEELEELEEDEDFDTAMRHVQTLQTKEESDKPAEATVDRQHELVDDFIRNFFLRMNMRKALDTFQTEWYEMIQSGEIKADNVGKVPDVYQRNTELENRITSLSVELDKAKEIAHKARSTWDKFRKERDFHRMHHRRVAQEKNGLVKDLRRLKEHIAKYEPTLEGLEHKYQLAMKEKAMARLQVDRLNARVQTLETQLKQVPPSRSAGSMGMMAPGEFGDAARVGTSNVPGTASNNKSSSRAGTSSKSPTKAAATRGKTVSGSAPQGSTLPPDDRENPFLGVEIEPVEVEKFEEKKSFQAHMAAISSVAVHPRKSVVASASDDSTWKMWAIPTGDLIMTGDGHKDWVSGIDFHPHGTHLATASGDGTVKLWSFQHSKCVATFTEHSQAVWSCGFHDMGDFLVSGSMDQTCKLWDLATERSRLTLRGHVDSVNHVVFQPFSNNIATCSGDKTVSLWDARSGLCIQTFYGHLNSCNHVAFNARGDTLASTDADGSVRLWDIRMVQEKLEAPVGPHAANKCTFDRSGHRLVVASEDGSVKVLNTEDGAVLAELKGHEDGVQGVAFDAQGQNLVTCGSDNTFRLWS